MFPASLLNADFEVSGGTAAGSQFSRERGTAGAGLVITQPARTQEVMKIMMADFISSSKDMFSIDF